MTGVMTTMEAAVGMSRLASGVAAPPIAVNAGPTRADLKAPTTVRIGDDGKPVALPPGEPHP